MWKWLRRITSASRGSSGHGRSRPEAVDSTAWNPSGWWWCLEHRRVEQVPDAPGHRRLGPYDSALAAEHWRERFDARNEEWDEADRRWAGDR